MNPLRMLLWLCLLTMAVATWYAFKAVAVEPPTVQAMCQTELCLVRRDQLERLVEYVRFLETIRLRCDARGI